MDRTLDVSGLEPPEPLERILEALDSLPADDRLRVRHRREPFPLYTFLRQLGFAWRTDQAGDGAFDILIWQDARHTSVDSDRDTC